MVDRYTKAVLTLIAAALLTLVAQNAIRSASAQSEQVQKVQICDNQNCVGLKPVVEPGFGSTLVTSWGLSVVPTRNP